MHTGRRVRTDTCTHACMPARAYEYARTHERMHTHTRARTHVRTHTETHTQFVTSELTLICNSRTYSKILVGYTRSYVSLFAWCYSFVCQQ